MIRDSTYLGKVLKLALTCKGVYTAMDYAEDACRPRMEERQRSCSSANGGKAMAEPANCKKQSVGKKTILAQEKEIIGTICHAMYEQCILSR